MIDKLRYEYGLELTVCTSDRRTRCLRRKLLALPHKKVECAEYDFDPETNVLIAKHCGILENHVDVCRDEIEIHSPVFRKMGDIHEYYQKVIPPLGVLGLKPHGDGEMSGGGHLHVTPNGDKWEMKLLGEIFRDWLNRPYLNWIFNHPEDDDNAGSLLMRADRGIPEVIWNTNWNAKKSPVYSPLHTGKDFGLNLHVLFADRWLWWIERRWRAGNRTKLKYRWSSDIQELTEEFCRKEFLELVKTIGLNPKDYEHFLRNMRDRYKYGWRRD